MDYIQLVKSRLPAWFLALAAGAVLGANAGCDETPSQPSVPAERPRQFVREIPFLGGTEWLHTCGEYLVAVSRKGDVYVWEWGDLDKPPVKGKGEGGLATAFILPALIVTTTSGLLDPYGTSDPLRRYCKTMVRMNPSRRVSCDRSESPPTDGMPGNCGRCVRSRGGCAGDC